MVNVTLYSKRKRPRSILYNHILKNHPNDLAHKLAPLASVVLLITAGVISYLALSQAKLQTVESHIIHKRSTADNASSHLPTWEQCDYEHNSGISGFWVAFYLWWIFYLFIGLAVICDDFFVPSLEVISDKLKLSEDVAGATFMAAGSSAPELFTSVVGVWQETDVGVGAIVGSAIFNILIIISLTGALARQVLHLDWRPLARDMSFYAVSILAFMAVAWDAKVYWWEALMLLLLYVLYIVIMVFNTKLMKLLSKFTCCPVPPRVEPVDEEGGYSTTEDPAVTDFRRNSARPSRRDSGFSDDKGSAGSKRSGAEEGRDELVTQIPLEPVSNGATNTAVEPVSNGATSTAVEPVSNGATNTTVEPVSNGATNAAVDFTDEKMNGADVNDNHVKETKFTDGGQPKTREKEVEPANKTEDTEEVEGEGITVCCFQCCPKVKSTPPDKPDDGKCKARCMYHIKWVFYVLAFPYYLLFTFTCPDCSKPKLKKLYIVSFIISVLWILGLSFAMVTLVGRTGCILNVDEFTMGLVIIAVGTSVPDCLSSVMVARDGFGDMAVSNAIGSNVFDIDLGLGLPFLLSILTRAGINGRIEPMYLLDDETYNLYKSVVPIVPHVKFSIILLGCLVLIYAAFAISKFRLNRFISISFVILYVMFIAYALVQEAYCSGYLC